MTAHPHSRTGQTTSALAGAQVHRDGTAARQREAALALVRLHPGATSMELARCAAATLDRYQLARRLPELEREGMVVKGQMRKCGVTGHMAWVWFPREGQGALL